MKTLFFTLLVTMFSTSYAHGADSLQMVSKTDLISELNEVELKMINAREFVVKVTEVPGSAWPEITYYLLVDAGPLETIGLFAAYDIQKDYTPNVIKSKPVKHVTATDVQTEYELKIPFPLPNAHYTHGARLYQHANDYEVQFYMVKSTSAEEVKGSAYVSAYNGKTLMRYRTYVKPKSVLGPLVKKIMMKDVRASVTAIRDFVEKCKRENSPLLSKYSEFITRALKGEFVYQTIIDQK